MKREGKEWKNRKKKVQKGMVECREDVKTERSEAEKRNKLGLND